MKILDAKLRRADGHIVGTIWLEGWLLPVEFLRFISEILSPYKILSYSVKYIHGFRGKETQVQVFGVKIKEVENEGTQT